MRLPLEITFRGMDPSPSVEQRIREHVEKLEHLTDKIVRGEVVIEQPHLSHRQGNRFHVRVSLKLPGDTIDVSHDPGEDGAHEDVYVALRDAFQVARRRIQDYVHKLNDQRLAGEKGAPPPDVETDN